MAVDKYRCRACHKNVAATGQSPSPLRYRKHDRQKGEECPNSRTIIPAWIVKRGPEAEDSDVPVIGRDYAPCPECTRSPLLDDEGRYAKHIKDAGVPSAERVDCPMSGQPYTPEGEECPTAPATAATDASPVRASQAPASDQSVRPSPKDRSSTDAPPEMPATGGSATTPSSPRTAAAPSESEEMISKWAATARHIEDRNLPSPESTPTQPALPPRPDAPEAPPSSPSPSATSRTGADSADGAGAEASKATEPTSETPPDVEALAAIFPKSARTPDGISTDSAAPTPADVPVTERLKVDPMREAAARTSTPAAAPSTAAIPTTPVTAPPSSSPFAQPGMPFSQPAKVPAAVTDPIPMTVQGEQIAARLRELFYSFDNRRTEDNRSAQVHLGPSEIGTPCDRRLALSLLQVPPVNPGGDGWAAFVGTCVHEGLARMFTWASGDTGRFAVEMPLEFPSVLVPRGTGDLLDRTLCMFLDHKAMGRWSLDRLKTKGPSPTYRTQVHTYAFGARLKGEAVDHVAIAAWPREASSLADLYVWTEAYDPQVARDALARVDRIDGDVHDRIGTGLAERTPLEVAKTFPVADDCRFCSWYAPGDPDMTRGCNGRA